MFTFLEMLALVKSEVVSVSASVIGGLRGSTAISDLVASSDRRPRGSIDDYCPLGRRPRGSTGD